VDASATGVADAMTHARLRRQDISARAASVRPSMGLIVPTLSKAHADALARPRKDINFQVCAGTSAIFWGIRYCLSQ
jgi:hypothetical protein